MATRKSVGGAKVVPFPSKTRTRNRTAPRVCGLCGKADRLTKTECCHHWICDDEDSYVLFSYARNSCYRNHHHQTLCAYHANEEHEGPWQDCHECRESFPMEMYVWYVTNEYNFEVLKDPPEFEPTVCAGCGKRIVLPEGGYSSFEGKYWCGRCTKPRRSKRPNH